MMLYVRLPLLLSSVGVPHRRINLSAGCQKGGAEPGKNKQTKAQTSQAVQQALCGAHSQEAVGSAWNC